METNRKNINAAFAKMQQEAKQLGVELLTKPEVFIDDDHLCCVWYGGYIGGFMYKDYTVALEVHGDVVICGVVDGKDFEYTNRLNNGAMSMAASDHLRTAFKSDAELDKAIEDERIEYTANNWIEVFVQGPNGDWSEGMVVDETDNVLDADEQTHLISEFGWPKETIESDEFPALLAEASFESAATEYDTDEEYATFEDAARALGTLIGVYVEGYLTNGKETKK